VIINEITKGKNLSNLKPFWDELFSQNKNLTIFSSFLWNEIWWNTVGTQNNFCKLNILEFIDKESQRTIAIIPLMRKGKILSSLSQPYADYFDFLIVPGYEKACYEALLDYLERNRNRFIKLSLFSVNKNSKTYKYFSKHASNSLRDILLLEETRPCPILELNNETAAVRALRKKSTILKINRLKNKGDLSVKHFFDPESIMFFFDTFVSFHNARWANNPRSVGLFTETETYNFFYELSVKLPLESKLLFSVLLLDKTPIAFYYGFICYKTYYFYRTSFDIAYSLYSPGHVLLHYLLKYCIERHIETFDFLRGGYQYKDRYSNKIIYNCNIIIKYAML